MSKILYISAKTPFGPGETFILAEMVALKELGADIMIVPRDPSGVIFHDGAKSLLNETLCIPWFDLKILRKTLQLCLLIPLEIWGIVSAITCCARNIRIALKNLVVLPKALYLSTLLKDQPVLHIHAHWASTTATMAYIISRLTGIPWSFTAHRWDIAEDNLLKEKCRTASFVRVISERGREDLIKTLQDPSATDKISVIHMGVSIPKLIEFPHTKKDTFTLLCPANFVHVKGHRYLLEASRILLDRGFRFKCLLAGDGRIESELRKHASELALSDCVEFLGRVSHDALLRLYGTGAISAVVLPSIRMENGEEEGIPVALMEAMAYGIPVISTKTGGIPELIGGGCGLLEEEKNAQAIANSVERLIQRPSFYGAVGRRGREKVEREFNISLICQNLVTLFAKCSP